MKINLNDQVEFVLTDSGADILNVYYNQFKTKIFSDEINHKKGERVEMSLWETMSIFGPHIYMGMIEVPFQSNCIEHKSKS